MNNFEVCENRRENKIRKKRTTESDVCQNLTKKWRGVAPERDWTRNLIPSSPRKCLGRLLAHRTFIFVLLCFLICLVVGFLGFPSGFAVLKLWARASSCEFPRALNTPNFFIIFFFLFIVYLALELSDAGGSRKRIKFHGKVKKKNNKKSGRRWEVKWKKVRGMMF